MGFLSRAFAERKATQLTYDQIASLIAYLAGLLLQHFKDLGKIEIGYGIMFVICGLAYITAWVLMHLLVPKFKKIVV